MIEPVCENGAPNKWRDRPYPCPVSPYDTCVNPSRGGGPLAEELRSLVNLWQPTRYNRMTDRACELVEHHWERIGLPRGVWAYENLDDAFSEAIEAAEALGL